MPAAVAGRFFHPGRRAPGRGEKFYVRVARKRFFRIAQNKELVPCDREIPQGIVLGRFVAGVPFQRIVIGAYRQAAEIQSHAFRQKQIVKNAVSQRRRQRVQRSDARLVEASAKSAPFHVAQGRQITQLARENAACTDAIVHGRFLCGCDLSDEFHHIGSPSGKNVYPIIMQIALPVNGFSSFAFLYFILPADNGYARIRRPLCTL